MTIHKKPFFSFSHCPDAKPLPTFAGNAHICVSHCPDAKLLPTFAGNALWRKTRRIGNLALLSSVTVHSSAWAAGSSMPWEGPLTKLMQSVEGPVAKIIAVMIIISTGLSLAFGDSSGGVRRLIQIVFGLSIAFAASSFFLSFFSFGGGALV